MHTERCVEILANRFKDEFRLLRESDYWQYLPESTQKEISTLVDGQAMAKYQTRIESNSAEPL